MSNGEVRQSVDVEPTSSRIDNSAVNAQQTDLLKMFGSDCKAVVTVANVVVFDPKIMLAKF